MTPYQLYLSLIHISIVTVKDIREYLAGEGSYSEMLKKMDAYMEQYCVF